jgi:hypothetical protein
MGVISFFAHKFFFVVVFYIFTLQTFFAFYIQRLRLKVNFSIFNFNHLKELHAHAILRFAWDLNPSCLRIREYLSDDEITEMLRKRGPES